MTPTSTLQLACPTCGRDIEIEYDLHLGSRDYPIESVSLRTWCFHPISKEQAFDLLMVEGVRKLELATGTRGGAAMTEPYTCPKHNLDGLTSYCPECMAEFKNRRPVAELTRETRVAILRGIPEVLTIPFDNLHQWVEGLMGRPVWTHEFAHPEQLIEELESGSPADIGDVVGKLPWDKPVVLVDPARGDVTELP